MLPAQPNQSLIDGLTLLQSLAMAQGPLGSRELARQVAMEPTRVNRLLKTLAHLGLAEQAPDRRYQPGPGMHVLSAQALHGSGLIHRAIGPLEALHRFGHLVALGVLWQRQTCYLYHAQPGMSIAMALGRVGLYPASRSGVGQALLAQLPPERLAALYQPAADAAPSSDDRPAEAESASGIPGFASLAELEAALQGVRRQGYAYVQMPMGPTHTLAVPVGAPAFAAVALSGRIEPHQVDALVGPLREAAKQIAATQPSIG